MIQDPEAASNAGRGDSLRQGLPGWAAFLHSLARRAIGGESAAADEVGGSTFPLNVAIDLHKAATGPFVLAMMQAFGVSTAAAWTYVALHGTYGIAWVLKDVALGDNRWRRRVGSSAILAAWAFLTLYWIAPAILILGPAGYLDLGKWEPSGHVGLAAAIVVYSVGLVLMIGADAQKNALLMKGTTGVKAAPSAEPGLITTGFFARTRHPNYLGEMAIYASFALVVGHWLPWLILAAVWGLFFLPNMLAIEARLSRYPEYEAWRRRTGFLLPRLRGQADS